VKLTSAPSGAGVINAPCSVHCPVCPHDRLARQTWATSKTLRVRNIIEPLFEIRKLLCCKLKERFEQGACGHPVFVVMFVHVLIYYIILHQSERDML
jgi:hypothetical protein